MLQTSLLESASKMLIKTALKISPITLTSPSKILIAIVAIIVWLIPFIEARQSGGTIDPALVTHCRTAIVALTALFVLV